MKVITKKKLTNDPSGNFFFNGKISADVRIIHIDRFEKIFLDRFQNAFFINRFYC